MRAVLQPIERDFDDQLRAHVDDDPVAVGLDLLEPLGLPVEQLVGHALECLAEHHEAVVGGIAGAEVEVGKLAVAAAVAPLGGQHDEVQRVGLLDLEPRAAPAAGLVCGLKTLGHEPFLTGGNGGIEEVLGLLGVGGDDTTRTLRFRHVLGEDLGARGVRLVEQRRPIEIEDIKEEGDAAAQSLHGFLKTHGAFFGAEDDCLAIQYGLGHFKNS